MATSNPIGKDHKIRFLKWPLVYHTLDRTVRYVALDLLEHCWTKVYFNECRADRVLLHLEDVRRITGSDRASRGLPRLEETIKAVHRVHHRADLILLGGRQGRRRPWQLDCRNWLTLLGCPPLKIFASNGKQPRDVGATPPALASSLEHNAARIGESLHRDPKTVTDAEWDRIVDAGLGEEDG